MTVPRHYEIRLFDRTLVEFTLSNGPLATFYLVALTGAPARVREVVDWVRGG